MTMYLWLKAIHIIFMVTWFAGLFYLPRLFVYHAQAEYEASYNVYQVMERRLFIIMTIGAAITVLFGAATMALNVQSYLSSAWFHAKLFSVVLLLAYHGYCYKLMQDFKRMHKIKSKRWYLWFNEAPAALLIVIIILAVVKPF